MAKRRKKSAERRAAKKAAKLAGLKPKGKSRYAKRAAARKRGTAEKARPLAFCPGGCYARLSRAVCRCRVLHERSLNEIAADLDEVREYEANEDAA